MCRQRRRGPRLKGDSAARHAIRASRGSAPRSRRTTGEERQRPEPALACATAVREEPGGARVRAARARRSRARTARRRGPAPEPRGTDVRWATTGTPAPERRDGSRSLSCRSRLVRGVAAFPGSLDLVDHGAGFPWDSAGGRTGAAPEGGQTRSPGQVERPGADRGGSRSAAGAIRRAWERDRARPGFHQGACPAPAPFAPSGRAHLGDPARGCCATLGEEPGKAMGAPCASSTDAAKEAKSR